MKLAKRLFKSLFKFLIFGAKIVVLLFVFSILGLNRFFVSESDRWVMKDVDEQVRVIEAERQVKIEAERAETLRAEKERIEAEARARVQEQFNGMDDTNLRAQYSSLSNADGGDPVLLENEVVNPIVIGENSVVVGGSPNMVSQNQVDVSITVSDTGATVSVDDGTETSAVIISDITPQQKKLDARRKAIFGDKFSHPTDVDLSTQSE